MANKNVDLIKYKEISQQYEDKIKSLEEEIRHLKRQKYLHDQKIAQPDGSGIFCLMFYHLVPNRKRN